MLSFARALPKKSRERQRWGLGQKHDGHHTLHMDLAPSYTSDLTTLETETGACYSCSVVASNLVISATARIRCTLVVLEVAGVACESSVQALQQPSKFEL